MHPNLKNSGITGHCSLTVQQTDIVQLKISYEHLGQFLPAISIKENMSQIYLWWQTPQHGLPLYQSPFIISSVLISF